MCQKLLMLLSKSISVQERGCFRFVNVVNGPFLVSKNHQQDLENMCFQAGSATYVQTMNISTT